MDRMRSTIAARWLGLAALTLTPGPAAAAVPFYAVIRWQIQVAPIVMSKRIFDSLTPEQQAVIRAAAAEAVTTERLAYQKADVDTMTDLLSRDVKLTEPDPKPRVEAVAGV